MKKLALTICLAGIFSLGTAAVASAQAGHAEHHPQGAGESAGAPQPKGMTEMGGMPCGMMGGGMPGMMGEMEEMSGMEMMGGMDRPFFLDRAKELGLSDEQVTKLREIRRAALTDNIRTAAELQIARLDLRDLLAGEWTVETAEKLARNIQKMQGDMKVRFLKARKEAEKVLTPEQLKMARGGEAELEGLFLRGPAEPTRSRAGE